MKRSLIAMYGARLVFLLAFMRSLALAGDAEPLKVIAICPLPGSEDQWITNLAVSSIGDSDVVVAVPHDNAWGCGNPGVRPRGSIVLATWDKQQAELSLLRRFDDLPGLIGDAIAIDNQSCVFGVYGIPWPNTPDRFAAAYVVSGSRNLIQLKAPEDVDHGVAISPDGRLIAWCCREGRIRVRSVSSDHDFFTIMINKGRVGRVVFSNDGRMLAIQTTVGGTIFSNDGEMLPIQTSSQPALERTLLVDLPEKRLSGILTNSRSLSWSCERFSDRGNVYGEVTSNGDILVYNIGRGSATRIANPHGHSRAAFTFSSDARLVISAGWVEGGHHRPLSWSAPRPLFSSGRRVAGEVKVWDPLTKHVVKYAREPRLGEICSLALASDDRTLFVGDSRGRIGIFDLDPSTERRKMGRVARRDRPAGASTDPDMSN